MSYYVKVGDETTEIPECCNECYMCQDIYSPCDACLLISNTTIPHKYYCAADCNRVIQDILKKPEWCPILKEKQNEKI